MTARHIPITPRSRALQALSLAAGLTLAALPSAAVTAAASAPAASEPAPAPSASELGAPSEAERLLFMQPQLASIHEPRTIVYDYVSEGENAPRTTERTTLTLKPGPGGRCCSVHTDFLSGAMAVNLPDLDEPQGNPMVMHFLESEVRLLERKTKGQSAHFRRRIRQALADDATVSDTTVRWNGRDVPARSIHVAPFQTDPYRARFEREAKTEYTFVLSEGVPGGLVRMIATIPGAKTGDAPLERRSLSIADPQSAVPAKN
jgi:hypothetical protein